MKPTGRASRKLGFAIGAAAGAALFVAVATPAWAQGEILGALKRVDAVRFEDNDHVSAGALRKVIKTRGPGFLRLGKPPLYRPDFLRSDALSIQNLYARRGYLDARAAARADSTDRPDRVVVVFTIVEGRHSIIDSVRVAGAGVYPEADLLRRLRSLEVRPGRPADPVAVALGTNLITDLYADRGRFPVVRSEMTRSADSTRAHVAYTIEEGPRYDVGTIRIDGNQKTDSLTIMREIVMDPSELFRRNELLRSTQRLYDSGLFTQVDFQPTPVDTEGTVGRVDLVLTLRERQPRWVDGGVGLGTADGVRILGEWGHRNLWGQGRAVLVSSRFGFGRRPVFRNEVAYTEPWLLGTRTRGRAALTFEQSRETFKAVPFDQRQWTLALSGNREFQVTRTRLTLTLAHTWSEVIGAAPAESIGFRAVPFTRRLALTGERDQRDDPFDPRDGSHNFASAEVAGLVLGGQGKFYKSTLSTAWYFPLGRRAAIAARLRLGGIRPFDESAADTIGSIGRVPLDDRFRTGGSNTVRGYKEEGIDAGGVGGLLLVLSNLEYRFPLFWILSGAAFVDGGNVWRRPRDFKWEQLFGGSGPEGSLGPNDYRWSYGGGVRVRTPVGPLRADYGRRFRIDAVDFEGEQDPVNPVPADRWQIHISLGQAF